jgi:hypothetical protein
MTLSTDKDVISVNRRIVTTWLIIDTKTSKYNMSHKKEPFNNPECQVFIVYLFIPNKCIPGQNKWLYYANLGFEINAYVL